MACGHEVIMLKEWIVVECKMLSNLSRLWFVCYLQHFKQNYVAYVQSIQKSKNHQRRIFLDNYYRQRCLWEL
jgi:hypothetical protein